MIQGKLAHLNANENKSLINAILPQKAAVAEEEGDAFIFSDVQKISDAEQNQFFNNVLYEYYKNLVENLDVSTGKNSATFYFWQR